MGETSRVTMKGIFWCAAIKTFGTSAIHSEGTFTGNVGETATGTFGRTPRGTSGENPTGASGGENPTGKFRKNSYRNFLFEYAMLVPRMLWQHWMCRVWRMTDALVEQSASAPKDIAEREWKDLFHSSVL